MHPEVIKDFLIKVGFKVDENSSNKFLHSVEKVTAAATAAAGAITAFVTHIADGFERVGLLAKRVNSTAEEIQRLGYIASLTGSSIEAAESSIQGISKAAGDAALGIGRSKKVFEEIGVSVKDANGHLKNSAQLLQEVGQKVRTMESGKQIAVLSRLGIDPTMIRSLTTDVSGLGAEFDKVYKAAGIDADKASEQALELEESFKRLKFVASAVGKSVAIALFPRLQKSFDLMRKFIVDNLPQIIATIKPVLNIVLNFVDALITIVYRLGQLASILINKFEPLNKATHGWAAGILALALAWKKLNIEILLSPIGIVLALATAVALLYDDYKTFEEGGRSLINWNSKLGYALKYIVTPAIAAITTAFGAYKVAVEAARIATLLFDAIFVANPAFLLIAGTIAAIAASIYLVYTNWNLLYSTFKPQIDFMVNRAKEFLATLKEIASELGIVNNSGGANNPSDRTGTPGHTGGQFARIISYALPVSGLQRQNSVINQQTKIIVNGSANADATASSVAAQQSRVNGDLVRNTKGAAR